MDESGKPISIRFDINDRDLFDSRIVLVYDNIDTQVVGTYRVIFSFDWFADNNNTIIKYMKENGYTFEKTYVFVYDSLNSKIIDQNYELYALRPAWFKEVKVVDEETPQDLNRWLSLLNVGTTEIIQLGDRYHPLAKLDKHSTRFVINFN